MNKYYEKNKEACVARAVVSRRRYVARNREYTRKARDIPCADCGEKYLYYVMDFDHVRGKKLFNVGRLVNRGTSLKVLQTEMDKCDIVCSNCHRIRTFG